MEAFDFSDPSKKPPSMSSREWLWLKEGKRCHWCGCDTLLVKVQQLNQATNDHVIPRGRGGSDEYSNVVSACHLCNQRRNAESDRGLPEGALIETYTVTVSSPKPLLVSVRPKPTPTITHEDLLTQQRDQALAEIKRLRNELALSDIGWNAAKGLRDDAFRQMQRMTFRRLALIKLKAWIDRQSFKFGPVA